MAEAQTEQGTWEVPWYRCSSVYSAAKEINGHLSAARCNSFLSVTVFRGESPLRAGVLQANLVFISGSQGTLQTLSPRQLCKVVQGKRGKGIILQSAAISE